MLEPPSEHLWQQLRDGLGCSPADLRRARRRVKQLARDLPAFDSVWIDALVQDGRVTPYQARILESESATALKIGEYVLLEDLGHGTDAHSWLVRHGPGRETIVLKQLRPRNEQPSAVLERARKLIGQASSVSHPCIVPPNHCASDAEGVLLISPFVAGSPLADLLVRRGRFPADVVASIARQLVDGLSAWHRAGLVHGDIRRSHVRITEDGTAVLVEAGLRTLAPADVTMHALLALEAYDGVAPELIGVGRAATSATDWYALGCVLWQLLAGRPPFPMADPLAKLAAHQTRAVEDVREWAPETPEALAALIQGLTHADAQYRLVTVEEFRQRSGPPTSRDRRVIARFRRAFDAAVPHLRAMRRRDSFRWPLALGAACLGAALAAVLADAGLRSEVLSLAANWTLTGADESPSPSFSADLLPLPAPTPEGTILLTEAGPYGAATIRFPGTLTLRAADGVCPEIVIRDRPLQIATGHWKCDGVRFRIDRLFRAAEPAKSVVEVLAGSVTWQRCALDLGEPLRRQRTAQETPVAGVLWRSNGVISTLRVEHCSFHGFGAAFQFERAPDPDRDGGMPSGRSANVAMKNVLHLGRGPLLSLEASRGQNQLSLSMRHVTLRDSGALVQSQIAEPALLPRIVVTADDCVLEPRRGQAVLEYVDAIAPALGHESFAWSGEGSLLMPNVPLLAWLDSSTGTIQELPSDAVALDGLAVGQVQFAGLPTIDPAGSVVTHAETPRRSPEPPGIIADLFGACR